MSSIETIDEYNVKLTFDVGAKEFEKGLRHSYNKNKNLFVVQGFRKGKAPRQFIEKQYGNNIFFDDAFNFVLPNAYEQAVKSNNLHVVSEPSIGVVSASQEDGVVFAAQVTVVGEASVDEYYALPYKKYDTEPTDAEIQHIIDADREKNARIATVVRPIQMGDIVIIDYNGVINDEPFEGGHAEGFRLAIGEHRFIDTFEEQLIGAETGENIFVRVTFPEDYDNAGLAGKPAVFDVKINEIQEKELPDLDDEFAQDISDFDTFEEYREDIIKKIRATKEYNAAQAKEEQLMSQLVSNTSVDLPPVMVEKRIDELVKGVENRLKYQGMTLEEFLRQTQQTIEVFREGYREAAINQIKTSLALEAVAKKENLRASEDEINAELDRLAGIYKWNDKQKNEFDKDIIAGDLAAKKAFGFIVDHAIEIT